MRRLILSTLTALLFCAPLAARAGDDNRCHTSSFKGRYVLGCVGSNHYFEQGVPAMFAMSGIVNLDGKGNVTSGWDYSAAYPDVAHQADPIRKCGFGLSGTYVTGGDGSIMFSIVDGPFANNDKRCGGSAAETWNGAASDPKYIDVSIFGLNSGIAHCTLRRQSASGWND